MKKTAFTKGDLVFKTTDAKRRYPIKISSVRAEKNEIFYRGSFVNNRGVMVSRKFKESDLIAAR